MTPMAFAAWEFACGGITALCVQQLVRIRKERAARRARVRAAVRQLEDFRRAAIAAQAQASLDRLLADIDAAQADERRRRAYRAGMDIPGLP